MLLFAQTSNKFSELLTSVKANIDTYIVDNAPRIVDLVVKNVLPAVAIFFVGQWVAKYATRLLAQALRRAKLDETLSKFLCRLGYAAMMVGVSITALKSLGVDTTTFAAVVAASGLAIGLAFQGTLSNFAAGVMIIIFRPFKVGDFVEVAGSKGKVEEIHIFSTLMNSPDNVKTFVPNGSIIAGNITNYSYEPTRRVDLVFGCGYGDDLRAVKQFLIETVNSHPLVLHDPEPVVAVNELGDNSVNFVVRPWVRSEDYWTVRWDLIEQVKLGFDQRGFEIPFPQRTLHVLEPVEQTAEDLEPAPPLDPPIRPRRVA
ncbi:MAG: mechanosensitive ion channel [Planctomycetales bacterium]|nr:mechanosensitive ion channel [Planctomycetales bacterium]